MNKHFDFLIVGLGSIGSTHLKYVMKTTNKFAIVDPNLESHKLVADPMLEASRECYLNIDDIPPGHSFDIAIISNWGPDHYQSILQLKLRGIKKFIVEKPLVSKLDDLNKLRKMVKNQEIQIVVNMPLSISQLSSKLVELSDNEYLGDIHNVVVTGGAKCLVTNGIHYVGLASKIFQTTPTQVIASINTNPINPRSAKFLFAEGTATWHFSDEKWLSVSFSNNSHLQVCIEIVYTFGRVLIDGDLARVYVIENEKRSKIDKPARTFYAKENILNFNPFYDERGLDGMGNLYDKLHESLIWEDFEHGAGAAESIIGMLIASKIRKHIKLPLTQEMAAEHQETEWNIS